MKTSGPALGLALQKDPWMDLRKDLRVNLEVDLWLNPQVEKQRYEETDQIFVQSSRKSLV